MYSLMSRREAACAEVGATSRGRSSHDEKRRSHRERDHDRRAKGKARTPTVQHDPTFYLVNLTAHKQRGHALLGSRSGTLAPGNASCHDAAGA